MDHQPPPDIRERAKESFEKILLEHRPDPLPQDIQVELQNIMKAAERRQPI
jgi:trimethylamine:corrinoid methyltransferase-like protein